MTLILSHPAKESPEETISPQTSRRQELSGWWMAPPGGRTWEQRLLPGKKPVKEASSTPSYLSLSSLPLPSPTAVVSYFWNLDTSLSPNLVLKGTFQQPLQVSTVKVAHVLQNLTCVPKCHHYRPLDLYQEPWLHARGTSGCVGLRRQSKEWGKGLDSEMLKRWCLSGKMSVIFPSLLHA